MLRKISSTYLVAIIMSIASLNVMAYETNTALSWQGYALGEEISNVSGGMQAGSIFNTFGKIVAVYDLKPKYSHNGLFKLGFCAATYTRDQYAYTNAIQAPSAYLAPRQISPSDFSYTYYGFNNVTSIIGIMDLDDYFNITESALNLLNTTFSNTMSLNADTLLSTAPFPAFGAMAVINQEETTALFGLFQGDPKHLRSVFYGGYMAVAELQQRFSQRSFNSISYLLKGGLWFYQQHNPEVARGSDARGIYLITQANYTTKAARNLATFLTFGYTAQEPKYVPYSITAGVRSDHIFFGNNDSLSFGLGKIWITGYSSEVVYELAYAAELYKRLTITPDVQYVVKPSGYLPNALVLMLRLWYSF